MDAVPRQSPNTEGGFTLIELLIVIVILGVLAVVAVFAVRGITDRSEENACAAELGNLERAQNVHWTMHETYADEATLVANGVITNESAMYDVTVTGNSYEIVSVGGCTGSGSGGDVAPPPPPIPVTMPTSSFGWHGGVTAWRFGADANGDDEIVVLGREQGKADWVAATGAGASSTPRPFRRSGQPERRQHRNVPRGDQQQWRHRSGRVPGRRHLGPPGVGCR